MSFVTPDFTPVIPEIFVLGMTCLILLIDLFLKPAQRDITFGLTQFTLLGAFALSMLLASPEIRLTFGDSFIQDPLADLLKGVLYLLSALVFLYARPYLKGHNLHHGEFYILGLFGVLGMMIMISAYSLLTLYLGLELLALSLYAMVALKRDCSRAVEAAMKYFILGALASGLLLYGMSILYGLTGSLNIQDISAHLTANASPETGSVVHLAHLFALSFILVGLAFKLGAVPFHTWMPDVYQGASTPVALYIGSVTKLAAFAIVIRLLIEGLQTLSPDWQGMLLVLAVLSLLVGNLIAIAQTNIKRMLAYSTIAHVGFIIMGLLAATASGYNAALFYVITYAIMATGAFGVLLMLSQHGTEAEHIHDLKGLNEKNPWLAFIMLLLMASMAGFPPTVGFYAKLAVLQAVLAEGYLVLAIYAVILSVIGAFYYLRIIKMMYFDAPQEAGNVTMTPGIQLALSANGLLILMLGILPGLLMALTHSIF